MERATWITLLLMLLAATGFGWGQGFRIAPDRAWPPALACAVLAGAWQAGRRWNRPRLEVGALAFLQMTLFTVTGVVLAYAIAARGGPLWDNWLARADAALGIDWPGGLAILDRSPVLIVALGVAYHSLSLQMVAAIILLIHVRRIARLQVLVAAAVLSGFVTILISAAIPAAGKLFDPADYTHLWPSVAWLERELIGGLRDGSHRVLDLTMLMGIVSFPSFHATLAAIFVWALRDVGRTGAALATCAVLTIIATPVLGGHHVVDVLAGLALAPPAIAAAAWLRRRRARPYEPAPQALYAATGTAG